MSARKDKIIGSVIEKILKRSEAGYKKYGVGLDKIDSGKIELNLNDSIVSIRPKKLHKYVGYVTEDRRNEGLWLKMSIIKNISISILDKISNILGIINRKSELEYVS